MFDEKFAGIGSVKHPSHHSKDFMQPVIDLENAKVFHGNSLEVLKHIADNSIDAIVTDPPYGLNSNDYVAETIAKWIQGERDFIPDGKGFMGKSWDSFVPPPAIWDECLRVLKPGGHLLAFFGSRTQDIGALSIRLAGFEIRDSIAWLYGLGFPKSHNISKAIDRRAGAKREVIGSRPLTGNGKTLKSGFHQPDGTGAGETVKQSVYEFTAPATPEAIQWEGWGTALKPRIEPVIVARKPLEGTVVDNVLKYGTGGINIDATRIGDEQITINTFDNGAKPFGNAVGEPYTSRTVEGRWPTNVILDEHTAELIDEQQDGVSRFFYVAKANKRDRNEGLDSLPDKKSEHNSGNMGRQISVEKRLANGDGINAPTMKNFHPTVKPTDLMRYLVKLVCPPNGTVLDPFTGSGSTGKASLLEGFKFIGIEMTDEYLPIIEGRLKNAEEKQKENLDNDLFG
jgi:site-specific DNA-methyltransferase (adenine-specific)